MIATVVPAKIEIPVVAKNLMPEKASNKRSDGTMQDRSSERGPSAIQSLAASPEGLKWPGGLTAWDRGE